MPINAGNLSPRPGMDFMFEVILARVTSSTQPSGTTIGAPQTWTQFARHIKCDVAPMRDELYFQQTGAVTMATHLLHFFPGTDIRPKDRVTIYSSRRLAGMVGSWYLITD